MSLLNKVKTEEQNKASSFTVTGVFFTKAAYEQIGSEFHPYHKHDLNVLAHLVTTPLGVWGMIQLALLYDLESVVAAYAVVVLLTTPLLTGVLHSVLVACMVFLEFLQVSNVTNILLATQLSTPLPTLEEYLTPQATCLLAIALGYGLQDVAHYMFCEKTYMGAYIYTRPYMLLVHSVWLLPLVIDALLMRYCFLPKVVSRNRNLTCQVSSTKAVDALNAWIATNVEESLETTHIWPHNQEGTSKATTQLEDDASIYAAFRKVFAAHHFDVRPVKEMNEIYVTAVGAKESINSDAVFYTPHTDGPYWFLPGASLYRVLVGVTPNEMVRTRFNLQHDSQNQVLDKYTVVGFDYNRELHWIDHVPGKTNEQRRSLLKLHYIVYPKGWHRYGNLCARFNTNYNTWARGNFLKTLRPTGAYAFVLAWWIWLTTKSNSLFEESIGWSNLVYVFGAYALSFVWAPAFLLLTSFRHYVVYICTFAFRDNVALGYLMRDCKFFKTLALLQLGVRILPLFEFPPDVPCLGLAAAGFGTTMLACAQLGFVRTYFGSELGFVDPKWVDGFPYNTIPHPMIVGQLFAYGSILGWFGDRIPVDTQYLVGAHMACYVLHMVQEMLYSSY